MFCKNNKKEVYDIIFSMGTICANTTVLRKCNLQDYSFPWDWIGGIELKGRFEEMVNGFPDWFHIEDFVKTGSRLHPEPCDIYKNTRKDLLFVHDFPLNVPIEESLPTVKARYERRQKRMIECIDKAKQILFVWMTPVGWKNIYTLDYLKECHKYISEKYPDKEIRIKYFYSSKDEPEHIIDSGVEILKFDYEAISENPQPGEVNNKALKSKFKNVRLRRKITFKRLRDFVFSYRISKRDYTTKLTVTVLGVKLQKKFKKPVETAVNE